MMWCSQIDCSKGSERSEAEVVKEKTMSLSVHEGDRPGSMRTSTMVTIRFYVTAGVLILAWVWSGACTLSPEYKHSAYPIAIVAALLVGWGLQVALIGTRYKPRHGPERTYGRWDSWSAGLIMSSILALLGFIAVGGVMNRVSGSNYTEPFLVTGKYIRHGKSTCYGLNLVGATRPDSHLEICVTQSFQTGTVLGDVLQIDGRRSWYGNEIVSYRSDRWEKSHG